MAIGGQRPTFGVKNSHGQTYERTDPASDAYAPSDNRVSSPVDLVGPMQEQLWEDYILPAHWLTKFDAPKAHMWVTLQEAFLAEPKAFNAAMISQLRALGSELGLDPSSRARMGKKIIKMPVEDEIDGFLT